MPEENAPEPKKPSAVDNLDQLLANLDSKEFRIKNEAIKNLGKLRHQKARDKLYEIAENSSWNSRLRATAIEMLGKGAIDKRFIKIMENIANNDKEDKEIRRSAITQLSRLRDSALIPTFLKALDDEYHFIRMWALRGLIKMSDPKAISGLIKALGDENEEIRKEAQEHLELMGSKPLPFLVKAFHDSDSNKFMRFGIIGLLGRMDKPEAVAPLIEALSDGNPRVVTIAIRGLGKLKNKDSILPLIQTLKKNQDKLRLIEDALFHIGQENLKAIIPPLAELLSENDQTSIEMSKSLLMKFGNAAFLQLSELQSGNTINEKTKAKVNEFLNSIK